MTHFPSLSYFLIIIVICFILNLKLNKFIFDNNFLINENEKLFVPKKENIFNLILI